MVAMEFPSLALWQRQKGVIWFALTVTDTELIFNDVSAANFVPMPGSQVARHSTVNRDIRRFESYLGSVNYKVSLRDGNTQTITQVVSVETTSDFLVFVGEGKTPRAVFNSDEVISAVVSNFPG